MNQRKVIETTISVPVCETGAGSIPNDLFLLRQFEDYLDTFCARSDIALDYRPRRYQFSNFIAVRFYALLANCSTHHAAETLNAAFSATLAAEGRFRCKNYQDGKRWRRVVPYQTDVDKFLRRLSLDFVVPPFKMVDTYGKKRAVLPVGDNNGKIRVIECARRSCTCPPPRSGS